MTPADSLQGACHVCVCVQICICLHACVCVCVQQLTKQKHPVHGCTHTLVHKSHELIHLALPTQGSKTAD